MARQVVEPGTETLKKLLKTLGEEVIARRWPINRAKLGDIIFHEHDKRKNLNGIMHPAIRAEMLRQRDALCRKRAKNIL